MMKATLPVNAGQSGLETRVVKLSKGGRKWSSFVNATIMARMLAMS